MSNEKLSRARKLCAELQFLLLDLAVDYTPPLCKRCPYSGECKQGEVPGSNHCFAVLQRLNPLEAEDCV